MPGLRILLLFALLPLCAFAPGFFFVRKFRWSPLEKLCGSVGLSLVLLYLASFAIYGAGLGPWAFWGASAACVFLAAAARRDAARLLAIAQVRTTLLAYGFLLVWTLAFLGVIRLYSGAGWAGDWVEHFQRSLFFLDHLPRDVSFLNVYPLPARPPLMNLLGAFSLANAGDRFEVFQIAFAFLNLLAFLPCCLLMPALTGRRRRILPLAGLFALNPMFMENATYAWTKLFTVFYVALAMALYLAGLRKRDRRRIVAAFVALAAGMLAHYSAGPYLVFLAAHYMVYVFRSRPRRWSELAAISLLCGALLATWFGWSVAVYGTRATFASNTSIQPTDGSGHGIAKIAGNLADTLAPHPLRNDASLDFLTQPNALGWWRDYFFLIYQTNLIVAMGIAGGLAAAGLLAWTWRRKRGWRAGPEARFWLMLIPFCLALGIAVAGERDTFGQAHLTLQPLVLLGVTLVAGSLAVLPRAAAYLVVAGCALDFGLGIVLQARVEKLDNTAAATVFTGPALVNGRVTVGYPQKDSLSAPAWQNWFRKHQYALSDEWLGSLGAIQDPSTREAVAGLEGQLRHARAEDEAAWNGWYKRHGGSVVFVGDHFAKLQAAGISAPEGLIAAMFLAVMAALGREARRREPRAGRAPPPAPRKRAAPAARKRHTRA